MASEGAVAVTGKPEPPLPDTSSSSSIPPHVTPSRAMTTTTSGETGGEELVVADMDRTDRVVSKPHVEKRQLVHYGDLISSDSATSSEAEAEPSSDSSSDDAEGILKTALTPIDMEVKGYDLKSPPTNGSQFLLQVQHQRKQLPKVVSAKKSLVEQFIAATPADDTKKFQVLKMPESVVIPSAIEEFLPTQNWVSIIIHQFSNLYLKVLYWRGVMAEQGSTVTLPEGVVLPPIHENNKWLLFCFGTKLVNQIKSRPRQRNGVKFADSKVIANFFSDDIEIELISDDTAQQSPSAPGGITEEAATTTLMEDLVISDKNEDEQAKTPGEEEPVPVEKLEDTDDDSSSSTSDSAEDITIHEKHPPMLSILLSLPLTSVEDLLKMHIGWLKHYGWFHELQGKWIYALLACLEKPLPCAVIADIRELVRISSKVRNNVCESKVGPLPTAAVINGSGNPEDSSTTVIKIENDPRTDGKNQDQDEDDLDMIRFKEFVNTLNLFVCLAANYFQQHDLADPVKV